MTASGKVAMKGFSFIELLASVAIMGLLASVALPLAETTVRRQKENELRTALRDIRQGIDAYKAASINGKIAKRAEESGYPKTLEELVSGVDDASQPGSKLYFLRRIPRDPFSQDASVSSVDTWRVRSFQSPPDNPRPGDDVFDISSKSTQHGLNGIPYNEW
ncbi:type IV pilin protein [Undibacterium sp. CY21W]|uniref:type IV pilin protein n=1 Tax=Undibacterium sp. CY21W TaxID=2762293 RepID=UPI00164BE63A|nr:type II secretion system protein [Undibacterium sp. CY21W]MBC3929996.1 type II secretion system protein [Undibacterium sp. CY21W]